MNAYHAASNEIRLEHPFRRAVRSTAVKTLSIQLFSNTGRGIGTVVSRSDKDDRLSSER
jgi:hypothetical protein